VRFAKSEKTRRKLTFFLFLFCQIGSPTWDLFGFHLCSATFLLSPNGSMLHIMAIVGVRGFLAIGFNIKLAKNVFGSLKKTVVKNFVEFFGRNLSDIFTTLTKGREKT
jgi:hypothetical protein